MRPRSAFFALAAILLCCEASTAALLDGGNGYTGPQLDVRSLGVGCAYSQNDTATLRAALETGGSAAGKTLFVPSGCKILLGSPGAGDSVADLASGTTIECEDSTAGFVLARKACSDASDTPGAACTADNQCRNGTCDPDYSGGDSFAPTETSTYTVFGAAGGTTSPAIKRCGIWVNGGSGDSTAMGGAGKRWGYCDGAGTSVTGEGCYNACDAASGAFEGFACLTNGDCGVGACTARAGNCKANGGACTVISYATNWGASGAGKILPIAWGSATGAVVEDVTIYDHRRGDYSISVGSLGRVERASNIGDTLQTKQAVGQLFGPTVYSGGTASCLTNGGFNRCFTPSVTKGVIVDGSAAVSETTGYGWSAGINAKNYSTVQNSVGGGYGGPSISGWNGNTDLLINGPGVTVDGFRGGISLYCIQPEYSSGYNFLVNRAFCDGNIGPKFIISGAGNQYMGVRGAWSGFGVVGLGDQRGRCAGGTRSTKVCIFGAGTDATIGCPSSTCNPHADFPTGSATHFILGGGSLLHSDVADVSYLRAADGKRCTDTGGPCSVDGDCTNTTCRALRFSEGLISDVMFFRGGSNQTAIDLSASSIGVNQTSASLGGGPSIESWLVQIDAPAGFATGIKLPSLARACVGGSNAGASCTADATCTGGGKCRGQVEKLDVHGNVGGSTTPLVNWDWSYGDVSGLAGLLPTDDQPRGPVRLTAGEALTRGQLVSASTSADNTVVKTTTANPERAVGVALADTLSGDTVKVITQGVGVCIADGTISRGDKLKPSGSTAGRVVAVASSSDLMVASALAGASSGSAFDCLIGTTPPIQNTTASFPKFPGKDGGSLASLSTCSTNTQLVSVTHTATSGRSIRLLGVVPISQTTSATRNVTTTIKRGGSNCDSGSPTTLVTGTGTVANTQGQSVTSAITDTGQSGSVTYRLCACSSGAGTQADAGSALHLVEY